MVEADGAPPDVTEGTVLAALGQWLCATLSLSADAVMVGQVNRVAPPCGTFAIMTVAGRGRIATNRTTYGAGCRTVWMQQRIDVRVDLHGAGAGDGAGRVALLFRDPACADFLAGFGSIAPLHADPPVQRDFVSDAAQYEDTWQVTLSLQVNSTATFAQEFADTLNVGIFETDATFPPE